MWTPPPPDGQRDMEDRTAGAGRASTETAGNQVGRRDSQTCSKTKPNPDKAARASPVLDST